MGEVRQSLSILASFIFVIAQYVYINDIRGARVKPNIATFLIWAFMDLSLLAALIASHVWSTVPFIAAAAAAAIIICLFLVKTGEFYISTIDIVALMLGIVGIILWWITKEAAWNVYVVSVVNLLAGMLIVVKASTQPQLETLLAWRLNLIASCLLVLAVPKWTPVQGAVPATQLFFSASLNVMLWRGQFHQRKAMVHKSTG